MAKMSAFFAIPLLLSPASEAVFVVYGAGNATCGKMIRDSERQYGDDIYRSWLAGYLSGRRAVTRNRANASDLYIQLQLVCANNPTDTVQQAAEMLDFTVDQ